ncbi:MAG: hypothetical protein WC862_01385 [Patescibacteria group bacterium]
MNLETAQNGPAKEKIPSFFIGDPKKNSRTAFNPIAGDAARPTESENGAGKSATKQFMEEMRRQILITPERMKKIQERDLRDRLKMRGKLRTAKIQGELALITEQKKHVLEKYKHELVVLQDLLEEKAYKSEEEKKQLEDRVARIQSILKTPDQTSEIPTTSVPQKLSDKPPADPKQLSVSTGILRRPKTGWRNRNLETRQKTPRYTEPLSPETEDDYPVYIEIEEDRQPMPADSATKKTTELPPAEAELLIEKTKPRSAEPAAARQQIAAKTKTTVEMPPPELAALLNMTAPLPAENTTLLDADEIGLERLPDDLVVEHTLKPGPDPMSLKPHFWQRTALAEWREKYQDLLNPLAPKPAPLTQSSQQKTKQTEFYPSHSTPPSGMDKLRKMERQPANMAKLTSHVDNPYAKPTRAELQSQFTILRDSLDTLRQNLEKIALGGWWRKQKIQFKGDQIQDAADIMEKLSAKRDASNLRKIRDYQAALWQLKKIDLTLRHREQTLTDNDESPPTDLPTKDEKDESYQQAA